MDFCPEYYLKENEKNNYNDINTFINQINYFSNNKNNYNFSNFEYSNEFKIEQFIKINNELLKIKESLHRNKKHNAFYIVMQYKKIYIYFIFILFMLLLEILSLFH